MPHEELPHFSDFTDERILLKMYTSANDARYIVRRTLELIEQSRIMLRELDRADGRRTS
jgi:hypothetical protein